VGSLSFPAAAILRRRRRRPSAGIAWGALLLVFCSPGPGAADELGSEVCLACHGEKGFADPSGRPLFTDPVLFRASAHGPLPCTVCHVDATEIPHADELQPVRIDPACAMCHEATVLAYRHGVHGRATAEGAPEAAACADCHGAIHALRPHRDPESIAHWSKLAGTCGRCHANVELVEKYHIPVVRPVEAYQASVHARLVAAGERGAVCSDCHGAHEILNGSDPRSPTARGNVSRTCGACHAEVLAAYRESVHGVALGRGNRDVPVCTDCHGEHRILGAGEPDSPVFAANLPGETCGRCHGDARMSAKYGLTANVAAYQDSFHGLALRAGQLRVANCASCHGVHDIRSSTDPRSHVHPANLATTCGKCHPGAGQLFALGSVHGAPASASGWAVAWVRSIYLWLIGATVGFMTVHNLLDFARKARRPVRLPRTIPGDQPERMTRALRWQHGLVMVSFPVLAYTGFGLKYPESWWALPLRWEAALGWRGTLHRVAALVLLGALAWHLWQLATNARLRARMRGVLFLRQDLTALRRALAYNLGLRATPPSGAQFHYAEKIEYWAFLWGMLIMTASGLPLWFENVSLRLLPSWLLDVATAVHFYEAILATLAILVWHFYWVIFDPDVYPMDPSWWHGRAPASRVIERQREAAAEDER
jgi:cytochrome b subunit of formate dehydrogenase